MRCKLCDSTNVKIAYKGIIRDGGLGKYTSQDVCMYQCQECDVIWHEKDIITDAKAYYESKEYRNSLEGTSEAEDFYRLHDKDNLDKFKYTGTDIFRHKVVADIGCGCGAFLDFLSGVADTIIAVEPSQAYREVMDVKGFHTYAYATDAKEEYHGKVDVITSFDVIEHVDSPEQFLSDVYDLLSEQGQAIIGTPTDTPVMRELLGEIYERKLLFSTQHIWVLAEKNLKMLAERVGFKSIEIKYFQRYGIGNMLGWIREKEPQSDIKAGFITNTLDEVWKKECEAKGLADYIVLYVKK